MMSLDVAFFVCWRVHSDANILFLPDIDRWDASTSIPEEKMTSDKRRVGAVINPRLVFTECIPAALATGIQIYKYKYYKHE